MESLVTSAARALKPVIFPAAHGRGARLAFQVQKADVSLRMIDLESRFPGNVLRARPVLDSTRVDMPGPFSPDGSRISFYSYWAGFPAPLWVANRDGSNLRQIGSMRTSLLKVLWTMGLTAALFKVAEPLPTTFAWAALACLVIALFERRWFLSALFFVATLWFGWCVGWCFFTAALANGGPAAEGHFT